MDFLTGKIKPMYFKYLAAAVWQRRNLWQAVKSIKEHDVLQINGRRHL